ncbi:hypothetical protein PsorP6_005607 [Peronosclerospora sorghi]|uniref:Uncharacterized protein n=1 Tax=Peronosclerospora sorghi TaxID=230839 RepID=A0ACC0W365_9STRA|nr:hypothetical protein PsorP6_005607 [Peronosclerospora sorghi]
MEVEPIVVSFAIVLPFLLAGTFFYWKQETVGSVVQEGQKLKLVQWLKAHPSIGKTVGLDTVDLIVLSGFLLLQLNIVIGSLLIDKESGNLAKAGFINRTALALASMCLLAISSMEWVRRHFFRRFILLHSFSAVAVVSTVLHYYAASYWIVPAIVVYTIYRAVSVFGRGEASVMSATVMSNKVVQVELRRSSTTGSDFVPGQYVYIRVNSIGFEWHPFTISSSPLRNPHSFILDIKVQGHFTTELLALIQNQQLATVQVDGYYGSGIQLAPHMVFLAGGSGMTPFLSVLDHLNAVADESDCSETSPDYLELPRTLWLVWTCRDVEFLETYAELLHAVKCCSKWKCNIWLHLTHPGEKSDKGNEDDETQTEPDDLSDEPSPRMQRFYPTCFQRCAFSGHNDMVGVPVFGGTALGCVLFMLGVFQWHELSAKSFVGRFLLFSASAVGAGVGASLVFLLLRRRSACKRRETTTDVMDRAMEEVEGAGLDSASPALPSTPRSFVPTLAQSLLHRRFLIETERPDLRSRLREVHIQIRENYGTKANVMLLVSGPASLQADALLEARELSEPAFEVHRNSFLL